MPELSPHPVHDVFLFLLKKIKYKRMEYEWILLSGHLPAGACCFLWELLIHDWLMNWIELILSE